MAEGIRWRILFQELAHLRKQFSGRHLWARGYLAVSTGNLADEIVQAYIEQLEGEPVHDDSRFVIDNPTKLPPSKGVIIYCPIAGDRHQMRIVNYVVFAKPIYHGMVDSPEKTDLAAMSACQHGRSRPAAR